MNYFIAALKKYADFNGRASRSEYWYFVLFYIIIYVVGSFIDGVIGLPILTMLVSLGLLIPSLAVAIRRMHDVGKSGWFILIPIYSLILVLTKGDEGTNEYGPDPHGSYDDIIDEIGNN